MKGKENNGKGKEHCGTCGGCMGCGGYACGSGHSHLVARLVIGIIIVVIAFWLGLKLGELRAEFYNSGYYGSNMPWNRMMLRNGSSLYPNSMMQNYSQMMNGVNGINDLNQESQVTPGY